MIISLDELSSKNELLINSEVEYDNNIHDLKDSSVSGRIYINDANEIYLECLFKGKMIIEDSINLELIPYDFEVNIEENLDKINENYEGVYAFSKNTLDLKKILWQNIVLEVPISYSKVQDAELKGDGWELTSEDKKTSEIDPRLKKLEELLER